jgi:uncharacterized protein (TIGR03067 family)
MVRQVAVTVLAVFLVVLAPTFTGIAAGLLAAEGAGDQNKKDLDKLQGTWKLQSAGMAGKKLPAKTVKSITAQTITFAGENVTCKDIPGGQAKAKVDATNTPPAIRFSNKDRKVVREAVYQFDGEALKWAFVPLGQKHREDLFSKPGIDEVILTYKRDQK